MSVPVFYGPNRLRAASVTTASTVLGTAQGYLWDGFAAQLWEGTGPIVVDQGTAPALGFTTAIIAAGHNLVGATVTVQTDDTAGFASPTTLGSLTAPDGVAFMIPCSGTVERYTRITTTGAPGTLQIGELTLAPSVTAPRPPTLGSSPNRLTNLVVADTEAGVTLMSTRGVNRWVADWIIPVFSRTLRTDFMTFYDDVQTAGGTCWVLDDEGILRFAHLVGMTFQGGPLPQTYEGHLTLRELLG